jgi:hypothetical protein
MEMLEAVTPGMLPDRTIQQLKETAASLIASLHTANNGLTVTDAGYVKIKIIWLYSTSTA